MRRCSGAMLAQARSRAPANISGWDRTRGDGHSGPDEFDERTETFARRLLAGCGDALCRSLLVPFRGAACLRDFVDAVRYLGQPISCVDRQSSWPATLLARLSALVANLP
jgi:hypothetical protein